MKLIFFALGLIFIILGCNRSIDSHKQSSTAVIPKRTDDSEETVSKGNMIWKDSSFSKVSVFRSSDGNDFETVLENHSYLRGDFWHHNESSDTHFVISQDIRWSVGPHEGNDPFLRAKCYLLHDDGPATGAWSREIEADEGKLFQESFTTMYETVWYGCCSSSPKHTLFKLETGEKMMEYTDDLLHVELPLAKLERIIGYKCSETLNTESYEDDSLYIGTISYACQDSLISKIAFFSKPGFRERFAFGNLSIMSFSIHDTTNKIDNTNHLTLWGSDFPDDVMGFHGFGIKVKFSEDVDSTVLPIYRDKLIFNKPDENYFTMKIIR